jgi:hypothetical protein
MLSGMKDDEDKLSAWDHCVRAALTPVLLGMFVVEEVGTRLFPKWKGFDWGKGIR